MSQLTKNACMNHKCISLRQRSQSKKATYCNDDTYMTFWKMINYTGVTSVAAKGLV